MGTDRKDAADEDEGLPVLVSRGLRCVGIYAEEVRVGRDDNDGGWGERDPKE